MGYILDFLGGMGEGAAKAGEIELTKQANMERDEANFIRERNLAELQNQWNQEAAADERDYRTSEREADQAFQSGEKAKDRASSEKLANIRLKETTSINSMDALDKWYREAMEDIDPYASPEDKKLAEQRIVNIYNEQAETIRARGKGGEKTKGGGDKTTPTFEEYAAKVRSANPDTEIPDAELKAAYQKKFPGSEVPDATEPPPAPSVKKTKESGDKNSSGLIRMAIGDNPPPSTDPKRAEEIKTELNSIKAASKAISDSVQKSNNMSPEAQRRLKELSDKEKQLLSELKSLYGK